MLHAVMLVQTTHANEIDATKYIFHKFRWSC